MTNDYFTSVGGPGRAPQVATAEVGGVGGGRGLHVDHGPGTGGAGGGAGRRLAGGGGGGGGTTAQAALRG